MYVMTFIKYVSLLTEDPHIKSANLLKNKKKYEKQKNKIEKNKIKT